MVRDFIAGRRAVVEALRAGHARRVLLAEGGPGSGLQALIAQMARKTTVPVERVPADRLERLAGPRHQGVAAQLHPFEYAAVNDLLRRATDLNEPVWLMILDQIQDVQNLGSLIRTAEAVGVHGLILPARRASAVTPAVWRTSAGAVAHLPVARVTNLARTMSWLRRLGVWLVGLDTGADLDYCATELHGPLAIVVGGEHAGLRRLVREQCDLVVSIPMRGMVESLNAAVAGSVLLYEALRQRRQADPTGGHGLRKPAGRLIMV